MLPRLSHRFHPMQTSSLRLRIAAGLALAAALVGCVDDPAPLFEPPGMGTVAGQLFADVDNNGQYTPVGGDTLLAGVRVQLLDRGTSNVIAEATTADSGRFMFEDVPPGTHDVAFVANAATGKRVLCARRATVYIGEQLFLPLGLRLGCVIRIQAAEAMAPGSRATITGIVTVAQGTFRGDNIYLQDQSGGIQVFGVPAGLGLAVGDSVEVTGDLGAFRTELQIINPVVAANVVRGAGEVASRDVTVATLAGITTGTSATVGRLVTVRQVRVGPFNSGGGRNAAITAASSPDGASTLVRLDGNTLTTIGTAAFDPARCYDITGVVGLFDNAVQLKPRVPADVVAVPCS